MKNFKDTVDFEVEVVRTGDAALLVIIDGDEEVWFPFSQIDKDSEITDEPEDGEIGTITVSEWIALEKGLV